MKRLKFLYYLLIVFLFVFVTCLPGPNNTWAAPELRQGGFWTEEMGKQKLEEYAKTWNDRTSWEKRAAAIREGILRGAELMPLPPRTPLNPILHSKKTQNGYTVENIAIESIPGYFVTGNLYRPLSKPASGKCPAVLLTHGHCTGTKTPFAINKTGGRFSSSTQTLGGMLARMGAVAFAYDMTGVNESNQYPHTGKKAMSVQLWNSMRVLDYLTSLPEVDASRIGMTGASGGGTQTFLLAAVDPRVKVSIPVVQVSCYFFGGCVCESGMPIHVSSSHDTSNSEIAALHAPQPLLIISDGKDWTHIVPEGTFPYVQRVYKAYGAADQAENLHLPNEGHDYGPSKRQGTYSFMIKHLGLDRTKVSQNNGKVDEQFVKVESYESLCVFDKNHPQPASALKDPAKIEALLKRK